METHNHLTQKNHWTLLAKVAYHADKCPVTFSLWPVEDIKESSWTSTILPI